MRRFFYVVLIILICTFVLSSCIYYFYLKQIDTKYAIEFSKVFKTYNIDVIDSFFSENTRIVYNGKQTTYNKIRNNIILACKERKYVFSDGSSYGYGNDTFIGGYQDVGIRLYGTLNGESIGECNIKLKLKKINLFLFEIESIESDDMIFGYIFYGIPPKDKGTV